MYRIVYQYMYFLKISIFIFTSTWKSKQWQTKVNTSDFNGGLMWCRYCNALQQRLVKQNWLMVCSFVHVETHIFVCCHCWLGGWRRYTPAVWQAETWPVVRGAQPLSGVWLAPHVEQETLCHGTQTTCEEEGEGRQKEWEGSRGIKVKKIERRVEKEGNKRKCWDRRIEVK